MNSLRFVLFPPYPQITGSREQRVISRLAPQREQSLGLVRWSPYIPA